MLTNEELRELTLLAMTSASRRGTVIDHIKITRPPHKLEYTDGDAVNLAGIIVRACYANGGDFGIIPVQELTAEPDVAIGIGEYTSDSGEIIALRVVCETYVEQRGYIGNVMIGYSPVDSWGNVWDSTMLKPDASGATLLTRYNGSVYAANEYGSTIVDGIYWITSYPNSYGHQDVPAWYGGWSTTARAGNGTFSHIWNEHVYGDWYARVPQSTANPGGISILTLRPISVSQTITVQWPRPSDGIILTNTFTITVS